MKKNCSLYAYILLLFFMAQTSTSFCQKTPCITAVTGNNSKGGNTRLQDSGSAVIQKFTPTCNGNLSSFSFNYRVLENEYSNSGVTFPVNTLGNPYFVVDLTIYELATEQSIDKTPTSSLSQVFTKPNIQIPIIKPNPREDFAYFTTPIPTTPEIKLISTKQYCFVIQLNTAFCNNLIAQKRTRLGSSYTPPVIGGKASLNNLLQKNICNIELATRLSDDNHFFQKEIHFIRTNTNEPSNPMMMFRYETANYQGYEMTWENSYGNSLVFGVTVIPFLPDIQGPNILCPKSVVFLTNEVKNGQWSFGNKDDDKIAKLERWFDGSARLSPTPFSGNKGLVTMLYSLNGDTTRKLIQLVNDDKPTILMDTKAVGTDCQNTSVTLTGVAANNQALQLDGKSWAEMPNHSALGLTNKFTLEAWVSCTDPTAPQQIICKGEYDQEMGHYSLILFDNKIQFGFQTQPGYILKHPIAFKPGEWHHVAGSYDGYTMRLYIDGVQVATLETQATMIPNTGKLYIGQIGNDFFYLSPNGEWIYSFTYRMLGQIDEVRIWNVCRSPQDIKDNMNNTVNANNTGLVGYYKFNEPTSADPRLIKDYSSSQNDGYLYSSYFNGVVKLANCSAKKVPASIKFGDFSYHWQNTTTPSSPSIETVDAGRGYTYTITDSATGCSASSETVWVNMNTESTVNITIPNDSRMPYLYQENGIIKLTFNNEDFITQDGITSATKTMTRTINNSNCNNTIKVTATKSDCPQNWSLIEREGKNNITPNFRGIQISNNLPLTMKIMVSSNGDNITDNNPTWQASDGATLEADPEYPTNPLYKKLTINKESIYVTYSYQFNNRSCILRSEIRVAHITVTPNIATAICKGTSVTFTAETSKAVTTPTYQWKKKKSSTQVISNVGINSVTYTDAALENNDEVWCVLTGNDFGTSSNKVIMVVRENFEMGDFSFIPSNNPPTTIIGLGQTRTIKNSKTYGGGVWEIQSNNILERTSAETEANLIVKSINTGTTTVKYIKNRGTNCEVEKSVVMTVSPSPR